MALLNHMATPHRRSHIASLPCGATPHICKAKRQTLRSHRSFAAVTVARRYRLFNPKRNNKKKNRISDMVKLQALAQQLHTSREARRGAPIQDADAVGYSTLNAWRSAPGPTD